MYKKIRSELRHLFQLPLFKSPCLFCRKDDTIPVPLSHDRNNGSAHIYSSLVSSYAKGKLLNKLILKGL